LSRRCFGVRTTTTSSGSSTSCSVKLRQRNLLPLGKALHPTLVPSDQLFTRNVSAEIFVVCREFLAPKAIDPKFLDPKHVFKDLDATAPIDKGIAGGNAQANVFQPEKRRRHRDGYADNNYTLFKQIGVAEFINASDPIAVLGAANKMTFTTEEEKSYVRRPPLITSPLFTCRSLVGLLSLSPLPMSRPTWTTSRYSEKATSKPCSNGAPHSEKRSVLRLCHLSI